MKDIESYSNQDLQEELEARGYRMCDLDLDLVDRNLLDDIIDSFLAGGLKRWVDDEVNKQLKEQDLNKSREKENLKTQIENLKKKYNSL